MGKKGFKHKATCELQFEKMKPIEIGAGSIPYVDETIFLLY